MTNSSIEHDRLLPVERLLPLWVGYAPPALAAARRVRSFGIGSCVSTAGYRRALINRSTRLKMELIKLRFFVS